MTEKNNRILVTENRNQWSREAQQKTRVSLETLPFYLFMNQNRCHLKNSRLEGDRAHGFVTLQNAMRCRWIVESEDYPVKLHYHDVDSLVNDGWVLD